MTNKYILAISGNDIFSGGGLYADLATYTTNHLHGFLAVTCLTALTDKGFEVFALPKYLVFYSFLATFAVSFRQRVLFVWQSDIAKSSEEIRF